MLRLISHATCMLLILGASADFVVAVEKTEGQLQDEIDGSMEAGDVNGAVEKMSELRDLRARIYGKDDWRTKITQHNIQTFKLLGGLSKEERGQLDELQRILQAAQRLQRLGKPKESNELLQSVVKNYSRIFGEAHLQTVQLEITAASNHLAAGDRTAYEISFDKVKACYEREFGSNSPMVRNMLIDFGVQLDRAYHHEEAEAMYRDAISVVHAMDVEKTDLLPPQSSLALNLIDQGEYSQAVQLLQSSLRISLATNGPNDIYTANCLIWLGSALGQAGRWAESVEHLDAAEAVLRQNSQGRVSSDFELTDGDIPLALCHDLQGQYQAKLGELAVAEKHCRDALKIRQAELPEGHPRIAISYSNLAQHLNDQGKHRESRDSLAKAMAIYEGPYNNPDEKLRCQVNLIRSYLGEGDYARVISEGTQLLESGTTRWSRDERRMLGEFIGKAHYFQRDDTKAVLALQQSCKIWDEQTKLLLLVGNTDSFNPDPSSHKLLSILLARRGDSKKAFETIESSYGRVLWSGLDLKRALGKDEADKLFDVSWKFSSLRSSLEQQSSSRNSDAEDAATTKKHLTQAIEFDKSLFDLQSQLESKYGPTVGEVRSIAHIQQTLPPETALVGFVDVNEHGVDSETQGEHFAYLLRSIGDPVWIDLTSFRPRHKWTKEDSQLPSRVRAELKNPRGMKWKELVLALRDLRIEPILPHLGPTDGLPRVNTLIALPSTALAGIPLDVLFRPDDKISLSHSPSATLFSFLKEMPKTRSADFLAVGAPQNEQKEAGSTKDKFLPTHGVRVDAVSPKSSAQAAGIMAGDFLLEYGRTKIDSVKDLTDAIEKADDEAMTIVVWRNGNSAARAVKPGRLGVALNKTPVSVMRTRGELQQLLASQRSHGRHYPDLPGAEYEIAFLSNLFSNATTYVGAMASEQQLQRLVDRGDLSDYRFVHFATHGVINNQVPLRSSILLSSVSTNATPLPSTDEEHVYDGRVTIREIQQDWKLDAELVTLSACETALGKLADGEGFRGFSQTLLLSGARNVCLSLWKVDDSATALLMGRFYENMLGKRERITPMSKSAALSEAKQWLRGLSQDDALELVAELTGGVPRGKTETNLTIPDNQANGKGGERRPFSHPYYWAAFILIGS